MDRTNIPQTDSIQELADFWDTHNLTDFEIELNTRSKTIISVFLERRFQQWRIAILH